MYAVWSMLDSGASTLVDSQTGGRLKLCVFFFNDTATTEIYTLSLHDALPISQCHSLEFPRFRANPGLFRRVPGPARDRKSTRLNSSHSQISYAVFCLKKKKNIRSSSLDHRTHSPPSVA